MVASTSLIASCAKSCLMELFSAIISSLRLFFPVSGLIGSFKYDFSKLQIDKMILYKSTRELLLVFVMARVKIDKN